jgi:glycosyltransferase involved in cell wall biosynthesis
MESLRQRIRSLPDANRIVIAGASEHPQEWIQSADIFISGSLLEGMPLAPLEAAGCGLPTLLSDIEGHRFLEPWARYFDPRKPEEGARKILEILQMLKREEGNKLFETRWEAAASLRQMWGAPAMTASYAETFESA